MEKVPKRVLLYGRQAELLIKRWHLTRAVCALCKTKQYNYTQGEQSLA